MSAKRLIFAIGVWYFLIAPQSQSFTFTKVGPFATQAACQNYQAGIITQLGSGTQVMTACFNTTSKQ